MSFEQCHITCDIKPNNLPDRSNHHIHNFPDEVSVLGKREDVIAEVNQACPTCQGGEKEDRTLQVVGERGEVLPSLLLAVKSLLVGEARLARDAA